MIVHQVVFQSGVTAHIIAVGITVNITTDQEVLTRLTNNHNLVIVDFRREIS